MLLTFNILTCSLNSILEWTVRLPKPLACWKIRILFFRQPVLVCRNKRQLNKVLVRRSRVRKNGSCTTFRLFSPSACSNMLCLLVRGVCCTVGIRKATLSSERCHSIFKSKVRADLGTCLWILDRFRRRNKATLLQTLTKNNSLLLLISKLLTSNKVQRLKWPYVLTDPCLNVDCKCSSILILTFGNGNVSLHAQIRNGTFTCVNK